MTKEDMNDLLPERLGPTVLEELSDMEPILPAETYKAVVGEALKEGEPIASRAAIISALSAVQDPELMLDIYSLGLIYDIQHQENGDVFILMTLTTPMCPIAGEMPSMAANAVSSVVGTGVVTVELTFDPPWTIDRVSEEIRLLWDFNS